MADGISCDRCDKSLLVEEDIRYRASIRVWAAYDPMEVTGKDLERDLEAEIQDALRQAEEMDPEDLQDQVYREIDLDLCPPCQKEFLLDPAGRGIHAS